MQIRLVTARELDALSVLVTDKSIANVDRFLSL